jgi:hypothetical protein
MYGYGCGRAAGKGRDKLRENCRGKCTVKLPRKEKFFLPRQVVAVTSILPRSASLVVCELFFIFLLCATYVRVFVSTL